MYGLTVYKLDPITSMLISRYEFTGKLTIWPFSLTLSDAIPYVKCY